MIWTETTDAVTFLERRDKQTKITFVLCGLFLVE